MSHMFLELLIWSLIAFAIGCLIGCLLRKMFGAEDVAVPAIAAATTAAAAVAVRAAMPDVKAPPPPAYVPPKPVPLPEPDVMAPIPAVPRAEPVRVAAPVRVAEPVKAPPPPPRPEPVMAVSTGKPERPKGIAKARGGTADNLQRISGVGPKNEKVLHSLGFFHFDQIAEWTGEQVSWVDEHLKFGGRIKREEWKRQARLLADGKEDEFTRLYGTGGLRGKGGETRSGSRTRKR